MHASLTPKQKKVLDFIIEYSSSHDYAPSLREIAEYINKSLSSVQHLVNVLQNKGYLKKEDNVARGIIPTNASQTTIFKLGVIAAGRPIEPIENPEPMEVPASIFVQPGNYYALQVKGSSMIEEGIFNGDIVIIRQQQIARNGQTVVAIIDDNQATLKKIFYETDRIRLQPANQSMLPLFRTDVEIRGVVVKIIRELESSNPNDGLLLKIVSTMPHTTFSKRVSNSESSDKAKPFIQWVGGKREMIKQYQKFIPTEFNNYYEPFLGGGAMFFYLQPKQATLSDNNLELIKTYEGIRDYPEEVISLLREFKSKHSKDLYTKIRNLDREVDIFEKLSLQEIAARMIYLNQTCFNALYRVNQKGQFNVPIGSSLNRLICDEHTIRNASAALAHIKLKVADFENIVSRAEKDDFVYLDPPYYPISAYSDFTRYTKEKFYQEDQIRLKKQIDTLSQKKCKVMMSNSDCVFIRDLYKNYKIYSVLSSRTLN